MCEQGWHKCATCGDDIRCSQNDRECPVMNGYEDYCYKCEHENEIYLEDLEREERRKWERKRWEDEYGWNS